MAPAEQPAIPRRRSERDLRDFVAVHVVWELTLACNLKCSHCGSRAGKRPGELTTAEALDVVDQLARLGTRELTIIGGERTCVATGRRSSPRRPRTASTARCRRALAR